MPLDPNKRAGKGKFSDQTLDIEVDQELVDGVLKKAETRTILFDYLHMFFVGFVSALKGLLGLDKGSQNKRKTGR